MPFSDARFPQDDYAIKLLYDLMADYRRGGNRLQIEERTDHMRMVDIVSFHFERSAFSAFDRAQMDLIVKQQNAAYTHLATAIGAASLTLADFADKINPKPKPAIEELGTTEELIVGYRDFSLVDGALKSRNCTVWPAREKLVASCKIVHGEHVAPQEHCKCGVYAFTTPKHKDMRATSECWGEVYLWGDSYICETGYRAQYAYPKSIFLKDEGHRKTAYNAGWLEQEYGVPVFRVNTRDYKTSEEYVGVMAEAILRSSDQLRGLASDEDRSNL